MGLTFQVGYCVYDKMHWNHEIYSMKQVLIASTQGSTIGSTKQVNYTKDGFFENATRRFHE